MWIERLTCSRGTHALELATRFYEERHKVLAENVANIDTPDYHTKILDPEVFREELKEALHEAKSARENRLELRGDAQIATDSQGRLTVKPRTRPAANILFHDGSNASLEQLMTEVQKNSLDYQLAASLLNKRFFGLMNAIRGKVS